MISRHVAIALPSGGTDTEGTRAFLQERIGLWAMWVFILSGGFYAMNVVTWPLVRAERPVHSLVDLLLDPGTMFHLAATVLFGVVWLLMRSGRWSLTALRMLDVGVLVTGCGLFAIMGLYIVRMQEVMGQDATIGVYAGLLAAANVVMARAITVPSTATRTLWGSIVAMAPQIPVAAVATHGARLAEFNVACWCAVSIAIATVGSRVIFGLRSEAARVRRLGQYTLEEKIGEGGMGIVYRASHAMLRRPTAIKLLPPERAGETSLLRFEREVQMTAQLSHPNTVAIYDYGRTPEGVFYYAMEFLDGINLEELVRRHGPQAPGRVISILEQVCGSLAEAHGRGLVHRDIKPANVILTERGGEPDVAKVVDFGLVRLLAPGGGDVTRSSAAVLTGTPLYMSPEALTVPDSGDPRSDLYAVGAVGYFLLTGRPVFEGGGVAEIIGHHLHTEPVPPSSRTTQVIPQELDAVILRCLRKQAAARPADARSLRDELLRCPGAQSWSRDAAAAWWRSFRQSGSPTAHRETAESGLTLTVDVGDRLTQELTRY